MGERRLLTKHCSPANRANMLAGHFYFGTHSSNWPRPGQDSGLFSDAGEGSRTVGIGGGLETHYRNASFAGFTLQNVTISGFSQDIAAELQTNNVIFCSSIFDYRYDRHRFILEGDDGYEKNEGYTAFLTIDADLLCQAVELMGNEVFGYQKWICWAKPVIYGSREAWIPSFAIEQRNDPLALEHAHYLSAIFTKPPKFKREEEFRFALLSDKPAAGILTKNLSRKVQKAFARSIVDPGSDNPRP